MCNPPAFPFVFQSGITNGVPDMKVSEGMSLRDWFAGMALQGVLRSEEDECGEPPLNCRNCSEYASQAYRLASAMLAEREKWQKF